MPTARNPTEKKTTTKEGKGPGRPSQGTTSKRSGVYVRIEEDQHKALEGYIVELNEKRAAAGLKPMALSTWLRELGLKHSGNEDLGAAARALREAKGANLL